MATYTRNNETINESDIHQLTSAADSLTVTNITVVSGDPVAVPDYWEPYTVNGGVFIYDGRKANDTLTARNVKVEAGFFQFIGGEQNDKLSVSSANVSGGTLNVNGDWDNDTLSVSNVTISGGRVNVHGDTGTDTVSVSKVSVTGGTFMQRDHGRSNINTASEVTIQGGHFEVSTGILERVGDDKLDSLSVVNSIGGSNTISANKISMTGGSLAVYSEGANNSVKVADVTMSGGSASIYGGKTANINGGKGTDTISVSKVSMGSYYANLSVFDGGSNNSISVEDVTISGGYVSIYGEGGNNTITANKLLANQYSHLDIHAQEKANSIAITNSTFTGGYGASIYGEGGNDTFSFTNNTVTGDEIKIWGGSSADNFNVEDVTISGGTVSINGNGGADNFTVDNVSMTGGNIYVIGGNGNANVSVSNIDKTGGYVDIDMGGSDSVTSGNDTISVENISNADRAYFDIYARGGNDSISIKNSSPTETVQGYLRAYGGAGKDTIYVENISVTGYYSGSSINGGADDDFISVKSSGVNIYGEDGNDTIIADSSSGNIYAGAGNDSISATNLTESINNNYYGGEGNDTIEFYETWMPYYNAYSGGGAVTGDEGDDLIIARNATIYGTGFFGGGGNDTISVDNSTVTSGFRFYNGAGNDSISVSNITGNFSGDVMFYSEYSTYASDGNDTISLDNWTLTGDDSQRILINGGIFVGVDNSSINGADSISIKNIIAPNATFYVYGKGGNDTVSFENMTLGGLGTSYGSTNIRSGYIYGNFDSGNDTISVSNIEFYKGSSSNVSLNGGEGADTISVDGVTLGDENDGRYVQSHLTVTGGAGADVINVSNVSVTGSYSSAYILGEDGADKISVTDSDGLQVTGGDGNDTIYFGGAVDATLTDLASGDVVSLSGDYQKAYYKDGVFIYGTGVKVSLSGVDDVADISNITIYNGSTRTNFGSFVTVLEWKLENGVASYGDLFTVSGLSSLASFEDITVDGKAIDTMDDEEIKASGKPVVISANALTTSNVTISDGYTLEMGSDVLEPSVVSPEWQVSNGTANYMVGGTTEGYVLEDNQILYKTEDAGDAQITITGLNSSATVNDISLSGTTVTIKNNALDTSKTVTISDGYTLALGSDVLEPSVVSPEWQVSNGTANYMVGGTTEGYVLEDNQILYKTEDAGDAQITITGLNSSATVNDISLSGTTVTIKNNALDTSKTVTISDGYTLALGSDVVTPVILSPAWQVSGGTAKMIGETTAGYVLENNKIVYKAAGEGEASIIVTGLKSTATAKNISLDTDTNTVSLAASIVQGKVTITDGYALNMGKGTYSKSTVSGGNSADSIINNGSKLVINTGAGDDVISLASGTNGNTITGGTGDDTIFSDKGKNIYQYASGNGNDIIEGFSENDTLHITSGSIGGWSVSDSDLIFNVGEGSITILDGANKKINAAIGKDKAVVNYYTANGVYDAKKTSITLSSNLENTFTADNSLISVDGSAADAVEIIGNTKSNFISGGVSADTLNGGAGGDTINGGAGADVINGDAGNDKISGDDGDDTIFGGAGNDTFTGGAGSDVFVYTAGNDVITDYAAEDKISIASGEISSVSVSSKDIVLKVGSNTLKIKDGLNKSITINDETKIYEKGAIYNEDKTNVSLTAAVKLDSVASTLINVDGSEMSAALKYSSNSEDNLISGGKGADSILGNGGNDSIFGNAGNDKIFGGYGDDVLDGGAGNDSILGGSGNNTLTGGVGNDTFYFEGGEDIITDYEVGKDKIQLTTAIINSKVNNEDVIFETADGTITVQNGAGKKITTVTKIGSKATTLNQIYTTEGTYNDKQTALTLGAEVESYEVPTKSAVVSIDGSATNGVQVTGGTKAEKIFGGSGNDNLNGGAGNDTLYGGDGADSILGDAGNDKIFGDAGADTLNGGLGNDTLTGGAGSDVFVYSGGNDVIADYTEEDKISIASGEISSLSVSSKDVVIKVGSNTLKVKDGAGKKVTINDEVNIYEKGAIYNEDKTAVTLTASGTLESGIVNVDASALSGTFKFAANDSDNEIFGGKGGDSILGGAGNDTIFGNAGADKLFGDSGNDVLDGGAGNDTLSGGAGNDTLTGGDGNDLFIFESGNDVITDYAAKDKIKFTEEITNTTVSGDDVIFATASGKVTVKDSAGTEITYIDYNGKTIKQSNFDLSAKTLDLILDNNFMTDENNLDTITEQKFEVQNIETQNYNNLAQDSQNYLTFAKEK